MSSRSARAFTASRNLSDTRPRTTGDGTGIPNLEAHEHRQPRSCCQLADVAIEIKTVEALHFQRDVPVKQFRNGGHHQILRKVRTSARRFEVEDLARKWRKLAVAALKPSAERSSGNSSLKCKPKPASASMEMPREYLSSPGRIFPGV